MTLNTQHTVLLIASLVLLIAVAGCSTHHSALRPGPDGPPGTCAVPQSQASAPIAARAGGSDADAESAALAWLMLTDAGNYTHAMADAVIADPCPPGPAQICG